MGEQVTCDCPHCECTMDVNDAVERGGKYYCGEACASGHQYEDTCGHEGCGCTGEDVIEFEW